MDGFGGEIDKAEREMNNAQMRYEALREQYAELCEKKDTAKNPHFDSEKFHEVMSDFHAGQLLNADGTTTTEVGAAIAIAIAAACGATPRIYNI